MDVPAGMRDLPIWFVWKYENGTKVPYQSLGNYRAKANDPSTWSSLEAAMAAKLPLAFGFDRSYGIVGIDLDGCIVNDEIQPWAQEVIDQFCGTYIEYSPSGSGLKIIAKAVIPPEVLDTKKRVNLPELTIGGGKAAAIEFFVSRCYFTFTGERYRGAAPDVTDQQEAFEAVLKQYVKAAEKRPEPRTYHAYPEDDATTLARRYMLTVDPAISGQGGHDKTFYAACRLVQGFNLSPERAFPILAEWNESCVPPWSERELLHKLNSADQASGERGFLLNWLPSQGELMDFSGFMAGGAQVTTLTTLCSEPSEEYRLNLPAECLRPEGLIGEIIDYTLQTSIYPQPELALAGAIALMGCITGRKVETSERLRTNVYVMGLAPSGSGKEHAQSVNQEILEAAGGSELIGPESLASDAGLRNALSERPCTLLQIDEIGRMFQAMKNPGKSPHLFKIGDEFLKLFGKANKTYRGTGYSDTTKNVLINQPHCCIYGTSVPKMFWDSLTSDNVGEGLVGRFMVFESSKGYVNSQKPYRGELPSSIIQKVEWWLNWEPSGHMFAGTAQGKCLPAVIPFTEEAEERLRTHRKAIEERRSRDSVLHASIWSRSAEKACKLALLFACSKAMEHAPEAISLEEMDLGIKLSNWLTRSLIMKVDENVSENQVEGDLKRVLKLIQDGMTFNQLTRKTQWLRSKERKDILESLVQMGLITTAMIETSGRPVATIYRLKEVSQTS